MADVKPAKNSDLGIRTVTAIAMLAVAGGALWLGGWFWTIFVLMIGVGVWFEWSALCLLMFPPSSRRTAWRYAGAVYAGIGVATLMSLRDFHDGPTLVLLLVGAVIATDTFAYFTGRTFGGPKIAPAISPSKTWSGLIGGMIGASLMLMLVGYIDYSETIAANPGSRMFTSFDFPTAALLGSLIAIVAQTGDFFESWMKRKAGVKDSGKLLPGHGGLFDRVDGLLAVLFVGGLFLLAFSISRLM